MKKVSTTPELSPSTTESNSHLFDDWFDPIESGIRDRVRGLIEEMIRGELDAALSRPRYGRRAGHADDSGVAGVVSGHRHGSRVRTLTGETPAPSCAIRCTISRGQISCPRFLVTPDNYPPGCYTYKMTLTACGWQLERVFGCP
jgi:hypothetical protein